MNNTVVVAIPATTANMGPGFDCLGMSLSLYNEIHMSLTPGFLNIEIEGEGAKDIARDERNIAFCAAKKVFTEIGESCGGYPLNL
ncbi:hypothetical protein N752_22535 [Desulforamulus aquiferis]|nr:hypothetical protein [Desulforamulus aquiferis]RYD02967.1 hypothetical protein N752_22535 [Desulforamulus aquiferis]